MRKTAKKVIRKIIQIDEEKCDGCGNCVLACAEGALKIIDGKARLVSDEYCDSLGACLPGCPRDAISIVEREAAPFDEEAARLHVAREAGPACGCQSAAVKQFEKMDSATCACPSASVARFSPARGMTKGSSAPQTSELAHWPVQLALVPPHAPFLQGADVLLAADCSAFCCGSFHSRFLKDHALLVACPKLDDRQAHLAKLSAILKQSDIRTLTILRMEVPCCGGLTGLAGQALSMSGKNMPVREIVLGTDGEVLAG